MNWEAVKTGLVQAALMALFAGTTGYLFGTNQTALLVIKIERLSEKLDRAEIIVRGRRDFLTDTTARVEMLCNEHKDCRTRFDPMHVPE